jgi:hypothetical protein
VLQAGDAAPVSITNPHSDQGVAEVALSAPSTGVQGFACIDAIAVGDKPIAAVPNSLWTR